MTIPKTLSQYKKKQYLFILLFLLPWMISFSYGQKNGPPPLENGPVEVSVTLRINKIYNINSVNETYQIDGYVIYSWKDERVKFDAKDSINNSLIYENDQARELMKNDVWIPAFEFINVQGSGVTPNIRIEIYPDGTIEHEKRFFYTLNSDMDYTKFPFDSQSYKLSIESFSYGTSYITFKNPKLFLEDDHNEYLGEDWKHISNNITLSNKQYRYMDDDVNSEKNLYSRVTFDIKAKRLSGYYQWQVLFPLLIIILASFAIFWIQEFSTQVSVGFTLMLTVVAFNFYSASILPKLSYNTFIEYVIIVGYIFIFLGIIAVIINHRINGGDLKKKDRIPLFNYCRYGFPIVYSIIMIILYFKLIK